MKTIVNKTRRPLKIRLPGGKTLHLGPLRSGQISDHAVDDDTIQRLVKAGEIEIAGEAGPGHAAGGSVGSVPEATHGHPPTTVVLPKGNR
ncbi:MAG: hypothetical protein ACREJ6_15530 [Candidatus Methylomirabilis sp.]